MSGCLRMLMYGAIYGKHAVDRHKICTFLMHLGSLCMLICGACYVTWLCLDKGREIEL